MASNPSTCLVILAGGQSTRMGTDKAAVEFAGQRMVDIQIGRFSDKADCLKLSALRDYGTGLDIIMDDPDGPGGPVGGIYSIAAALGRGRRGIAGFVTVPVDAPFAPDDLIERLSKRGNCAVAGDNQRIHPTFAYWRCDIVNSIRATHDIGAIAPSLHWLARQAGAQTVIWSEEKVFANINRPQDLKIAEQQKKAGA